MGKVLYIAIILSEDSHSLLLSKCPPKHAKIFAHHVTLVFKPSDEQIQQLSPYIGKECEIEVIGGCSDEKGQAVLVKIPKELHIDSQRHHITISCNGVPPSYSNELIKGEIDTNIKLPKLFGTVENR